MMIDSNRLIRIDLMFLDIFYRGFFRSFRLLRKQLCHFAAGMPLPVAFASQHMDFMVTLCGTDSRVDIRVAGSEVQSSHLRSGIHSPI
jgi:hypothetical protein